MFNHRFVQKAAQAGIALALAAMTFVSPIQATAQSRVTFEVYNESGFEIRYLYMSSTADTSWERDLLGSGVLHSGYHIPVNVVPGRYDLKLVDEDGDRCVLRNIAVYRDSVFYITPTVLIGCEVVSE